MKIINKFIIPVFLILISCSAPKNFTQISYSSIEKNDCQDKSDNVFLFSGSDSLNFDYKQVGLIGVTPGDEISESEIETLIKLEAWKNCANGIILPTSKSSNNTDINEITKGKVRKNFQTNYNYIAIKMKEDSAFMAKYGSKADTSFVSKGIILQNKLHEPEPSPFEKFIKKFGEIILSMALSSLLSWFTLWVIYNPYF